MLLIAAAETQYLEVANVWLETMSFPRKPATDCMSSQSLLAGLLFFTFFCSAVVSWSFSDSDRGASVCDI